MTTYTSITIKPAGAVDTSALPDLIDDLNLTGGEGWMKVTNDAGTEGWVCGYGESKHARPEVAQFAMRFSRDNPGVTVTVLEEWDHDGMGGEEIVWRDGVAGLEESREMGWGPKQPTSLTAEPSGISVAPTAGKVLLSASSPEFSVITHLGPLGALAIANELWEAAGDAAAMAGGELLYHRIDDVTFDPDAPADSAYTAHCSCSNPDGDGYGAMVAHGDSSVAAVNNLLEHLTDLRKIGVRL